MPKYDAFGREIGENTLAGLGGDSNAGASPRPEPAPADGWADAAAPADGWADAAAPAEPSARKQPQRTQPERPQPERPQPDRPQPERPWVTRSEDAPVTVLPGPRPRRGKGLGCLVALLVFVGAVSIGPIIAVTSLVDDAQDAIDDVTGAIDPDELDLPETPNVPDSGPPPSGITGRSLIAPRNFRRALRAFDQAAFTRATRLDLRPDRLTVTAISGDSEVDVRVGYDGAVSRGDISRLDDAFGTIALADLDPAAPARLVRGAARRYRVKAGGIDYVLAGPEPDGHHWRAYFKNGIYVEGSAKGRVIRRFDGG